MMPNITRGEDAAGLIAYLFGPGSSNEHTDPHLVGSQHGMACVGGPRFDEPGELRALAKEFDAPRDLFGTEISGGYVWHCSISLPPDDGELGDERWQDVARRMVDGMGFSETSGKAPCRWIAVHHGKSTGGNDHIHLVVNLVRDDGTKADVYRDYSRAQAIAGALEKEMGLREVEGRARGRGMPGIKRGEQEAARRRGRPEPDRLTLARRVRAASTLGEDEADFVRRLRGMGVMTRPRYAPGGRTEVVGYSVALHPKDGATTVWYAGGKLAADLTLTRLRTQWPESDPRKAVQAWGGTDRGGLKAPAHLRDESAWEVAAQQVAQVRAQLAEIPVSDQARWCQAAREAAGVMAVWSARMEPNRPGPLARAADVLARSAQRPHDTGAERSEQRPGALRGAGMAANHARDGGSGLWGQLLLMQQLRNTMRAFHDMHRAREERDQARALADQATGPLAELQARRRELAQSPGASPTPERSRRELEAMRDEDRGRDHGR